MQLRDFYRAYRKWVADGAPVDNVHEFHRGLGLCSNLDNWVDSQTGYPANARSPDVLRLRAAMRQQFVDAGLCESYPFGDDAYSADQRNCTMHMDPQRLAWVREHC